MSNQITNRIVSAGKLVSRQSADPCKALRTSKHESGKPQRNQQAPHWAVWSLVKNLSTHALAYTPTNAYIHIYKVFFDSGFVSFFI